MSLVNGKCPLCGNEIRVPDSQESCFCPSCGEQIISEAAIRFAASPTAPREELDTSHIDDEEAVEKEPRANQTNESSNDFLQQWETKGGMVAAGIILPSLFLAILNASLSRQGSILIPVMLSVAMWVFCAAYALVIYPTYFKDDDAVVVKSNNTASFLNGMCGGLIGCLWCSNMTKKTKGISNIVVGILDIVAVVLVFVALFI